MEPIEKKRLTGFGGMFYILSEQGDPVMVEDIMAWSEWMIKADRTLAYSTLTSEAQTITISTIFLGMNHNYSGKSAPTLFETIVFTNGPQDRRRETYNTWREAEAGHQDFINQLNINNNFKIETMKKNPPAKKPATKTATEKVKEVAQETTTPEQLPEKDGDIQGGDDDPDLNLSVDEGDGDIGDDDDDDDDDDDEGWKAEDAYGQEELKGFQAGDQAEEKKPAILHAKDFDRSVYPEDTEEGADADSDVVIVTNKEENAAYFQRISDKDKATQYGVGLNQRYTFDEATALAKKILNS